MKHVLLFESYFTESEDGMGIEMKFKSLDSSNPNEIADTFVEYIETEPDMEEVKKIYQMLKDEYDFWVDEDTIRNKDSELAKAKLRAAKALRDYGKQLGMI